MRRREDRAEIEAAAARLGMTVNAIKHRLRTWPREMALTSPPAQGRSLAGRMSVRDRQRREADRDEAIMDVLERGFPMRMRPLMNATHSTASELASALMRLEADGRVRRFRIDGPRGATVWTRADLKH